MNPSDPRTMACKALNQFGQPDHAGERYEDSAGVSEWA